MARNLKNIMRLIDVANEELPIEQAFLNDLKASIEKANKESHIPSQTIKPSSFNCIRNAYYQLTGVEPEIAHTPYNSSGICESGTDRHIRMQQNIERMKEYGFDCEYINVAEFVNQRNLPDLEIVGQSGMETKLYNKKYNMSFMCDGIIKFKSKYFIFEFKTETVHKFFSRKDVDVSHYNQGIAYSLNFGLDNVLFLYESRDTLDLKAYIFNVTNEMRNNLAEKIVKTLDYAKNNKVPPKPLDVLKKTCRILRI